MSERADGITLIDMLQSIEQIMTYAEKHNYESFINDRMTMDAVLIHIIVIGECVNKLTEEFKEKHNNIDWFKIRGMRNRITHDYRSIDYELAWEVIQNKIPEMKIFIQKILKK